MKVSLVRQPDLSGVVEITEKLRKESKVEHLYLVRENQAFAWFKGYKEYVNPPEEQMLRMKDVLVLHNHIHGTSFSFEDLDGIVKHNARELRIICKARSYIVIRPESGWGFSFGNKEDYKEYQRSYVEANKYMDRLIDINAMAEGERHGFVNHFTWKIFLPKFGIEYKHFGL